MAFVSSFVYVPRAIGRGYTKEQNSKLKKARRQQRHGHKTADIGNSGRGCTLARKRTRKQRTVDRGSAGGQKERIAVGRCAHDHFRADIAAAPR
jgi:hypothetical protein